MREKILNVYPNKKNRIYIDLNLNGKRKRKQVHILVAEAFIPNPDNKPEVNHIDGNSLNNNVRQLRMEY
jgi:hypothetical protein